MTYPRVLILNDTRADRHHGCYAVMSAICALLERNGMCAAHFWPAHADWRGSPEFDRALAQVRLVVVNGEGTIHHDRPAGRNLLEVGARARAHGVPVALINTGWEANGPDMVAHLGDFDLVSVRDSCSAERMTLSGAKVRVVPDLSIWHLTNQASGEVVFPRAGIGFTDNVDRYKTLKLARLCRDCKGTPVSICYSNNRLSGWARFLRDGIAMRQDPAHPARLAAMLRARHELWRRSSNDPNLFIDQVAHLKLLVSGRFHACTIALATGTPVIAQSSNTGKIAALFKDAGIEEWRAVVNLDTQAVSDACARGWSKSERENISAYLANATQAAEALFSDLADLAAR